MLIFYQYPHAFKGVLVLLKCISYNIYLLVLAFQSLLKIVTDGNVFHYLNNFFTSVASIVVVGQVNKSKMKQDWLPFLAFRVICLDCESHFLILSNVAALFEEKYFSQEKDTIPPERKWIKREKLIETRYMMKTWSRRMHEGAAKEKK